MTQRKALRTHELEAILPFATERQGEYISAVIKHGNYRAAGAAVGCSISAISAAVTRAELAAAARGVSPRAGFTHQAPPGFLVDRASNYYNGEGELAAQWVKIKADDERRAEMARTFGEELSLNVKPLKRIKAPKKVAKDLMTGYPVGDHHFGMYAHVEETGGNYDLKIAKQALAAAIDELVLHSPPAKSAVLATLGDLMHADNRSNLTPQNKNPLDVDTRYWKVARTASYGVAHAAHRLLEKHETLNVYVVPGNHDPDSSIWVALMLEAYFRNQPRVKVCTSPSMFLFHQFGSNMIGMTHGHTVKLEELPGIMAALEPKMWGETDYRVCWTGHYHHREKLAEKEGRGATSERFAVLPPNDAYGASRGFVTNREMHSITFRHGGGELCRFKHHAELS